MKDFLRHLRFLLITTRRERAYLRLVVESVADLPMSIRVGENIYTLEEHRKKFPNAFDFLRPPAAHRSAG